MVTQLNISSELKGKAKCSLHFQLILEIFQFVHENVDTAIILNNLRFLIDS